MNRRVITIVLAADDPATPAFCARLRQRLRHPQYQRMLLGLTDRITEEPDPTDSPGAITRP